MAGTTSFQINGAPAMPPELQALMDRVTTTLSEIADYPDIGLSLIALGQVTMMVNARLCGTVMHTGIRAIKDEALKRAGGVTH